MTEQDEQSIKKTRQMEKRKTEDAEMLAREQARKKDYIEREIALEQAGKARQSKKMEQQITDENKRLASEQIRKQNYLLKEKALSEANEVRKNKEKKDGNN
jgi:hypothetical protein